MGVSFLRARDAKLCAVGREAERRRRCSSCGWAFRGARVLVLVPAIPFGGFGCCYGVCSLVIMARFLMLLVYVGMFLLRSGEVLVRLVRRTAWFRVGPC